MCVNDPGSYHCECDVGYDFNMDNRTCSGEIVMYRLQ